MPLSHGRFLKFNSDFFPDPEEKLVEYFSAAYSFPKWLSKRWSQKLSTRELNDLGNWFNSVAPITLRVNFLKSTREEYSNLLTENEIEFELGEQPESIILKSSPAIPNLPGFEEGLFMVQDQTAMKVARLLNPKPGETILDLCAAPGTKTGHLAELMNNMGTIIACDVNPFRLNQIEENIQRFDYCVVQPKLIQKNSSDIPSNLFDAILIDAPCSNTGVLGKRPEARWRISMSDISELIEIQKRLILRASEMLTQDGRMVYSTCSLEPEENQELVKWFLLEKPDFSLISEHQYFPGNPADGGYQVLFIKK